MMDESHIEEASIPKSTIEKQGKRLPSIPPSTEAPLSNKELLELKGDIEQTYGFLNVLLHRAGHDAHADEINRFVINAIRRHGLSPKGREFLRQSSEKYLEVLRNKARRTNAEVTEAIFTFIDGLGNAEEIPLCPYRVEAYNYFTDDSEETEPPDWLSFYLEFAERIEPAEKGDEKVLEKLKPLPPVPVIDAVIEGQTTRLTAKSYLTESAEATLYIYTDPEGNEFVLKVWEVEKLKAIKKREPLPKNSLDELRDNGKIRIERDGHVSINQKGLTLRWQQQEELVVADFFRGPAASILVGEIMQQGGHGDLIMPIYDWGTLNRENKLYAAKNYLPNSKPYIIMPFREFITSFAGKFDQEHYQEQFNRLRPIIEMLNKSGLVSLDFEVTIGKGKDKGLFVFYDTSLATLDPDIITPEIAQRFVELQEQLYGVPSPTMLRVIENYKTDAYPKGDFSQEFRSYLEKCRAKEEKLWGLSLAPKA